MSVKPRQRGLLLERLEDRILLNAATPMAGVDLPSEDFINESFDFAISFDNSGSGVGFAPYVDVVIPDTIDVSGASIEFLGQTVTPVLTATFNGTQWEDGGGDPIDVHPLTGAMLDGSDPLTAGASNGDQLFILQLPFGSFTPDQPVAALDFSGASLGGTVGDPIDITARGGFAFGCDELDNPDDDAPLLQAPVSAAITPTVIELTKGASALEVEGPTGANFPITFTLEVDIATGETINNLVLTDVLPPGVAYVNDVNNLTFVAGGTPTIDSQPAGDSDSPLLQLDYGNVVGIAGADIVVTYSYYLPSDAISDDAIAGNDNTPFTNMAAVSGSHTGNIVGDTDQNTVTAKQIAIQKSVALQNDADTTGSFTPGDTLEYTLTFQISDGTDFSNLIIDDVLGDGLAFDNTFAPTYSFSEQGTTTNSLAGGFANFTFVPRGDGITDIQFRISDELVSRGQDGILMGDIGTQDPLSPRGTSGTVTFRATILENYTTFGPDVSIDIGDSLNNDVSISGTTAAGGEESDTSSASVTIDGLTLEKSIYAINGVVGAPLGNGLFTDDTVTYRIKVELPSADTENLVVTDFLPLPIFDATTVTIFDETFDAMDAAALAAPPPVGTVKFGPDHTLHPTLQNYPSTAPDFSSEPDTDAASNRIDLNFGTFDADPSGVVTIDVLFTVQVLDKPFGDGLQLTNQSVSSFGDTGGTTVSNTEIVQILLNQPDITLTKGVVATDNAAGIFDDAVGPVAFSAPGAGGDPFAAGFDSTALAAMPIDANLSEIDAGDIVKFAIAVENTGGAPAFDLLINDLIPAGFAIAGGGTTFASANGEVRLASDPSTAIGFTEVGSFFSGNDGEGIRIDDTASGALARGDIGDGSNILIVTYELQALASINPQTFHENSAHLDEFAAKEGGTDYTDGFEKDQYTDIASIETAVPEISKAFVTTDQTFTTGTEVAFGEIVTYDLIVTLPEGETPDVTIRELIRPGFTYVDGSASIIDMAAGSANLANDFNGTVNLAAVTTGPFSPDQDVTFTLNNGVGDSVVTTDDNDADNNSFVIRFDVVLSGSSSVAGGDTVANSAQLNFTDSDGIDNAGTPEPADPLTSNVVNITAVEPDLQITKDIDLTTVDAGDTITVTLSLNNVGSADAFDVTVEDVVDAAKFTNITVTSVAAGFDNVSIGNTLRFTSQMGVAITDGTGPVTFTFTADTTDAINPGETITNTAEITEGVTLPNGVPATDESRDVSGDTDSDSVDVVLGLDKSIVATSEAHTTGNDVAIGEIVRYRLEVEFPENSSADLQIVDRLPDGMTFINDGTAMLAFVSNGAGFGSAGALGFATGAATVNGTTATGVTPTFVIPDQNLSAAAESNDDTYLNGGNVFFRLGDLTNADTDADSEFIVIEFNALVGNIAANVQGADLINDFIVTTDDNGPNGQVGMDSNAITATVQEPQIVVDKMIATTANDAGDQIVYDIVIRNDGGASGFELNITDDLNELDAGVFTLTSAVFMPGATGATIVTDNNDIGNNLIDVIIDQLDATESVTIRVTADIANDLDAGREVSNKADASFSGLPGDNGTAVNPTGSSNGGDAGDPDGERDGGGNGPNNYTASSTVSFTVPSPQVDKELFDGDNEFAVGESIFYDILVTLPEGITSSLLLTDDIPDGMAFVSAQLIKNAGAPATPSDPVSNRLGANFIGVIANEGAGAFTTALITPLADGADFTLDFGDINTTPGAGTNNNEFVVRIEAVLLDTGASGTGSSAPTFTNNTQLSYLDPDDGPGGIPATTTVVDPTNPTITLVEPELSIDKSVVVGGSGTTGDAGDSAVYTIVLTHTADSTATAFDIDLNDTLPDEFDPTSFTATTVDLGNVAARFDLSGRVFTTIADLDLAETDTLTITFNGNLNATVSPGSTPIDNTVSGTYESADGDQLDKTGGANDNDDEITKSFSDDADISVPMPTFDKVVIDSDEAATGDGELTIGETVTFGIVVSLPEGDYGEIVISDDIPVGMDFVDGSAVLVQPMGYIGGVPALTVGGGAGSGADVTFTLTPFNVTADGNAANDQLTIQYQAIVLAASNGLVAGGQTNLTNNASVTLSDPDNPTETLALEVTGNPGETSDSEAFVAVEPELQIDKSSVVTQANAGDIVTYTIQVAHTANSTGPAFDVVITDALLEGLGGEDELDLVVGSVTTSVGTITSGNTGGDTTLQIDIPVYARTAAPITITYQATVNGNVEVPNDTVVNTASVDYDSHGDSPTEQRIAPTVSDDFTVNVPLDDIQLDKAVFSSDLGHTGNDKFDPALIDVVVGEFVTYRLTVTLVEGVYAGDDVIISEVLPDFLELVPSGTNPQIAFQGADVILDGQNFVSTSDGFTLTLDVNRVLDTSTGSASEDLELDQIIIEYEALVLETDNGSDNFNGNVITNSAQLQFGTFMVADDASIEVVEPELVIAKSVSDETPHLGDTITYTVVVEHAPGPNDAAGSGFSAYDLAITDNLHPSLSLVGGSVVVSDSPGGSASNVTVSTAGGILSVTADSLELVNAPQGFLTITYDAIVTSNVAAFGTTVNNTASISYDGAPGNVPGEKVETTSADESLRIIGPDLEVTKTDLTTITAPGQMLTYTIEVTNKAAPGGDAANADVATNVEVLDTIPVGTTFVSSPDATFDMLTGGDARWLIPTIAVGETVTLTALILIDDPAPPMLFTIENDVVVNNLDDIDPTPTDNAANDTTTLESGPNLSITKTDGLAEVVPGQSLTYTITATNIGNQNTTGVMVVDSFPTALLTNVSADMPTGVTSVAIDVDAGTITWDLGQLDVDEIIVLTVTADLINPVPAGLSEIANVVTISDDGGSGPDIDPSDNTATDTNPLDPVLTAPDYVVVKTNDTNTVSPNETTVYTITVSNVGLQGGTNVVVTDHFDPNVFANVDASDGGTVDFNAGTITWNLATLAGGGASANFTVNAKISSPLPDTLTTISNSASVSDDGANGADPDPSNNTHTDTDTIVQADLQVTKSDGLDGASAGEDIIYTIIASNAGTVAATGVQVIDSFPVGILSILSASTPAGVESVAIDNVAGTITWTLGQLDVGETIILSVNAEVTNMKPQDVDEFSNEVRIVNDGLHGPDLSPGDEVARDTNKFLAGFIFDGLRNEAFLEDDDDDPFAPLDEIEHEYSPPPIDALFSGHAEPGTTLLITLLDEDGASIGFQTVTADSGGNWVANFAGNILSSQPHAMTMEQQASSLNGSTQGGFNLRTYFSPATHAPLFFTYVPNESSAMAGLASNVMNATQQANNSPLQLDWDKSSSYEFLASSTTTTQYMN